MDATSNTLNDWFVRSIWSGSENPQQNCVYNINFISLFNDAENDFFFFGSFLLVECNETCNLRTLCKTADEGFLLTVLHRIYKIHGYCVACHIVCDQYKSENNVICFGLNQSKTSNEKRKKTTTTTWRGMSQKPRLKNTPSQIIIIHFTLWRRWINGPFIDWYRLL